MDIAWLHKCASELERSWGRVGMEVAEGKWTRLDGSGRGWSRGQAKGREEEKGKREVIP